jgi:hypothetical protein
VHVFRPGEVQIRVIRVIRQLPGSRRSHSKESGSARSALRVLSLARHRRVPS